MFLCYTDYSMVKNADVVRHAVKNGVENGVFAVRVGAQTVARRTVSQPDLQHAVHVRDVP